VDTRRVTDEGPPSGAAERRRYNRRTMPGEQSPPYYEVFERIAFALEGIQQTLDEREATKPKSRRMPQPRSE
jgi:hypothetical protein